MHTNHVLLESMKRCCKEDEKVGIILGGKAEGLDCVRVRMGDVTGLGAFGFNGSFS